MIYRGVEIDENDIDAVDGLMQICRKIDEDAAVRARRESMALYTQTVKAVSNIQDTFGTSTFEDVEKDIRKLKSVGA